VSDAELYLRGAEMLVASWKEYAPGASGAAVRRLPRVDVAVFPEGAERWTVVAAVGRRRRFESGRGLCKSAAHPRFSVQNDLLPLLPGKSAIRGIELWSSGYGKRNT
jgi:hypothetical protein